jgi:hypothetical protein
MLKILTVLKNAQINHKFNNLSKQMIVLSSQLFDQL